VKEEPISHESVKVGTHVGKQNPILGGETVGSFMKRWQEEEMEERGRGHQVLVSVMTERSLGGNLGEPALVPVRVGTSFPVDLAFPLARGGCRGKKVWIRRRGG
jgi:hypothetical protein